MNISSTNMLPRLGDKKLTPPTGINTYFFIFSHRFLISRKLRKVLNKNKFYFHLVAALL